jgi:hypothetical protein
MEVGIISLSDLQRDPATGRQIEPWQRLTDLRKSRRWAGHG